MDPLARWTDDFGRDLDAALDAAGKPEPSPEARAAGDSFNTWWKTTQEDVLVPSGNTRLPLEAREGPEREVAGRLQRLAEDRARLQERVDTLTRENSFLRERQAGIEGQIAELAAKLSRARESYESQIAGARADAAGLQERLGAAEQLRHAAEQRAAERDAELQRAKENLKLHAEKSSSADRALLELRQQTRELEAAAARLREETAAQQAVIDELRRQAGVYQERLVHAKELTDADVALLRQETRLFLDELRIVASSIKKSRE